MVDLRAGAILVFVYLVTSFYCICLEKVGFKLYAKDMPLVCLNLFTSFLFVACGVHYLDKTYPPMAMDVISLTRWFLMFLVFDVLFYICHRFVMHGPLRFLHNIHHSKTTEKGVHITGLHLFYVHPADMLVQYYVPIFLANYLCSIDGQSALFAGAVAVGGNVLCHSPSLTNVYEHLHHHSNQDISFGLGLFTDYLAGTTTGLYNPKSTILFIFLIFFVNLYGNPYGSVIVLTFFIVSSLFHLGMWKLTELAWVRPLLWKPFYTLFNFLIKVFSAPDIIDFMNWGYAKKAGKEMNHIYQRGLYEQVLGWGHLKDPFTPLLEVGCGHGGGLAHFHNNLKLTELSGLDFTPSNIKYCGKHKGPQYMVGNAMNFASEAKHVGRYKTIINVESSHCYPDFFVFLDNCHAALQSTGNCYFKMCDFRYPEEFKEICDKLKKNNKWELIKAEDITREVLQASANVQVHVVFIIIIKILLCPQFLCFVTTCLYLFRSNMTA
jgi:hypothetical protein